MTELPRDSDGVTGGATLNIDAHRSRLDRERRGHEAFAHTRRRAYVENPKVLERIDRYVIGEEEEDVRQSGDRDEYPLVITGDPGSGKSALMAHWSARFRIDHPDIPIVAHFVGAGTFGSEMTAMLHHLMHDLKEQVGIPEDPTDNAEELVNQFLSWVPWLGRRRVVIIVDALNQIRQGVSPQTLLSWIPEQLPSNLHILLSTLDGPILEEVRRREWNELRVNPLSEEERREVARRFIGGEERFRTLRTHQVQRVADNQRSANPLFLRTSLEELRLLNTQRERESQTEEYLDADNLLTLFDRILSRIEVESTRNTVAIVLRMIWASRGGLSTEEIAEICNLSEWQISRLLRALDYQLIARDGLYTFFHDHLRQAVQGRYASTPHSRAAAYRRLGTYFRSLPVGERRASEELHAWSSAGRLDELERSLRDLDFFSWLWHNGHKYEVMRYWKDIREQKSLTIEEAYAPGIESLAESGKRSLEEIVDLYQIAGRLAIEMSEYPESERLLRRGIELWKGKEEDSVRMIDLNLQLGVSLRDQGRKDEAEEIFLSTLPAAESRFGPESRKVGQILDSFATVYYRSYEFARALEIHRRAHTILRSTLGEDHHDTIQAMINIIACCQKLQQYDIVEDLYVELLARCERVLGPNHAVTATVLHNYALFRSDMEDYPMMRELLERSYRITLAIYGPDHLETGARLLALGSSEKILENLDKAYESISRALEIYQKILGPKHLRVATALTNLATLCTSMGDFDRSEEYCRTVIDIYRENYDDEHMMVHRSRLNLSNTLLKQGKYEEAFMYAEGATQAMRELYGPDNKWSEIWGSRYIKILEHLDRRDEVDRYRKAWGL